MPARIYDTEKKRPWKMVPYKHPKPIEETKPLTPAQEKQKEKKVLAFLFAVGMVLSLPLWIFYFILKWANTPSNYGSSHEQSHSRRRW